MTFPWVSRYRLEEAERRLAAADVERLRLLDLLLSGAAPVRPVEIATQRDVVKPVVDEELEMVPREVVEQGTPEQFSTPFDRVERSFAKAYPHGGRPQQFIARVK